MKNTQATVPSFLDSLAASSIGSERGYTFVKSSAEEGTFYSFQQLAKMVARTASRFVEYSPGTRVIIIIPENRNFIVTFLAALHAGLVPVPMAPPTSIGAFDSYLTLCRHVVSAAQPEVLVADSRLASLLGSLMDTSIKEILNAGYDDSLPEAHLIPRRQDDLAFLQFTSGSTSQPKGVGLSHGNLIANARCIMQEGLRATPEDIGCSWLPLFHDMGLIGFVLAPLTVATNVVFLQTLSFLRSPLIWLSTISRHRATVSFAPNFAYGLCVKRVQDDLLEGVDLSSWRVAGCGAEPIQPHTLFSFAETFGEMGFRRTSFAPCYGLAESTLAVSFTPLGRELKVDRVDVEVLAEQGIAQPVTVSENIAEVVSCGGTFEQHEVQILKPELTVCAEREIGEIAVRGPSVMDGYYQNEEATNKAFHEGWLCTGDLGYFADGELYVCGRIKDVVIIAGRNYYPTDIELAAAAVEGVRKGNLVAFGIEEEDGSEAAILCVETREKEESFEQLESEIRGAVMSSIGILLGEVVFLEAGTLPKTTSGKLQRTKAKVQYLEGTLGSSRHVRRKGESLGLLKHWAVSQWSYLRRK